MTANECTPQSGENVTDGIDYDQFGRSVAEKELERSALRLRDSLMEASMKAGRGELTDEDLSQVSKEIATAQVWVARVSAGEYLEAYEVLE